MSLPIKQLYDYKIVNKSFYTQEYSIWDSNKSFTFEVFWQWEELNYTLRPVWTGLVLVGEVAWNDHISDFTVFQQTPRSSDYFITVQIEMSVSDAG